MHQCVLSGLLVLQMLSPQAKANEYQQIQTKVEQALSSMLQNIHNNYAYAERKKINWTCLNTQYKSKIKYLKDRSDTVLFFEHLLLEFADSHMTLNTNIADSYRLNSPVVIKTYDEKQQKNNQQTFVIDDYWQNQLIDSGDLAIGAELITINGMQLDEVVKNFPTLCLDKNQVENQQWIINKVLAGQYAKPRVIELFVEGSRKSIDLDLLQYRETKQPLSTDIKGEFGVIQINNSLGETGLIQAFDQAIEHLNSTKGLVLDLRNTISGGDSYVARAIIGRFIKQDQPYQKHRFEEQHDEGPKVTRSWTEFVSPRLSVYNKPLMVLVNRWTGSMGEGLAIGLHGMQRAHVMGSPMAGLQGAVYGFQLEGMGFGYQMPAEQLFHVNGTPRESFLPDTTVKPSDEHPDEVMNQAIQWLQQQNSML